MSLINTPEGCQPSLWSSDINEWLNPEILEDLAKQGREDNELQPIFSLPLDVMILIFQSLAPVSQELEDVRCWHDNLWESEDYELDIRPSLKDISTISHVCHRWRQIAIETPSLWNYLSIGSDPNGLDADVINRRANMPMDLEVTIPMGSQRSMPVLSSKLRRMEIVASSSLSSHDSYTLDNTATPELECLKITFDDAYGRMFGPLRLPNSLFKNKTPNLRFLSLQEAFPRWDSQIFKNLTHLCIDNEYLTEDEYLPATHFMTMNRFLHILANCPNIVNVHVNKAGPMLPAEGQASLGWTEVPEPEPPTSTIRLPFLRALTLGELEGAHTCFKFLQKIHAPVLEQFYVSHKPPISDLEDLLPVTFALHPRATEANDLRFTLSADTIIEFELHCVRGLEEYLLAERTCFDWKEYKRLRMSQSEFCCRFKYHVDMERIGEPIAFEDFVASFCPPRILSFEFLATDDDEMCPHLNVILERLPHLKVLDIRSEEMNDTWGHDFSKALRDQGRLSAAQNAIAFPNLMALSLEFVCLNGEALRDLLVFLDHKKEGGEGVRFLRAVRCRGMETAAQRKLSQIVPGAQFSKETIDDNEGQPCQDIPRCMTHP